MNLFKSKVVPASIDTGWTADLPQLKGIFPRPMLVLARPFQNNTTEEATLTNMLKACGFGPEDFNLIRLEETERLPWSRISEVATPKHVLLLGVQPSQLSIEGRLPLGQASEFGGVVFILTHSLKELAANESARKSLWADVLKPIFKGG